MLGTQLVQKNVKKGTRKYQKNSYG